jgi:hypothetical protein
MKNAPAHWVHKVGALGAQSLQEANLRLFIFAKKK